MTNTKKFAASLALACAAMTGQAAMAADISNPISAIELTDGAGFFGRLITGNHAADTFVDQYSFDVSGAASVVADLYSYSGNAKNGLDITGFDLYNAAGTVVTHGTQLGTGAADQWHLVTSSLSGDGYYLQVEGNVLSRAAGTYGASLAVSAVPEPATYGMLLGGLALVGVMARRRKA